MWIDRSQLDSKYGKILREYCQLASQKHLSEGDAERLTKILILAETDGALSFLLNEADHFLAHELGLLNLTDRERYKEQQASLKARIDYQTAVTAHSKLPVLQKIIFSRSDDLREITWQFICCL
jgi:hypothetical protein